MTVINANSFEVTATETASFGVIETGTVEVTLGRETRRVEARRTTPTYEGGKPSIAAYGFGGRYNTGTKVWPAVVRMMTRGRGLELAPKPFWKLSTSLTTTPKFIAYAMLPRNVAEA